jgi:hypothetical protein
VQIFDFNHPQHRLRIVQQEVVQGGNGKFTEGVDTSDLQEAKA